jgi:hypothetical protein
MRLDEREGKRHQATTLLKYETCFCPGIQYGTVQHIFGSTCLLDFQNSAEDYLRYAHRI